MHQIHKDDRWIYNILGISLPHNGTIWVAGGAALSWYLNRPTNSDIDFYFKNILHYTRFREELEKKLRGNCELDKDDIFAVWDFPTSTVETENAITYDINTKEGNNLGKIQLIKRKFYVNPQECIEDFDISICQIATDGNKFWFGPLTLGDIEAGQFRFTDKIGKSSARRFIKYHAYGFRAVDSAYDQLFASDKVDWVRSTGADDYA